MATILRTRPQRRPVGADASRLAFSNWSMSTPESSAVAVSSAAVSAAAVSAVGRSRRRPSRRWPSRRRPSRRRPVPRDACGSPLPWRLPPGQPPRPRQPPPRPVRPASARPPRSPASSPTPRCGQFRSPTRGALMTARRPPCPVLAINHENAISYFEYRRDDTFSPQVRPKPNFLRKCYLHAVRTLSSACPSSPCRWRSTAACRGTLHTGAP